LKIKGLVQVTGATAENFPGHKWADPDEGHLIELMKEVVANPATARDKGLAARKTMVDNYAPKKLAKVIVNRLREVEEVLNSEDDLDDNDGSGAGEVEWSDADADL